VVHGYFESRFPRGFHNIFCTHGRRLTPYEICLCAELAAVLITCLFCSQLQLLLKRSDLMLRLRHAFKSMQPIDPPGSAHLRRHELERHDGTATVLCRTAPSASNRHLATLHVLENFGGNRGHTRACHDAIGPVRQSQNGKWSHEGVCAA
jgi:hypothetical protein